MNLTIIIHTENKEKLKKLLESVSKHRNKKNFSLYLHAKNYIPWEDEVLKNYIVNFKTFNAFPTSKSKIESIVEILTKVSDDRILLLDEDSEFKDYGYLSEDNFGSLYIKKNDIIKLNLDTKYTSIKWFIIDVLSQIKKNKLQYQDDSDDNKRYQDKVNSPFFYEKIIYIDGGMGDHIMSLPLLEKIAKDVYVSCKYEFVYQHLPIKGFIYWNNDLFGGYKRFVYEYGSSNNSKNIIDAFFEMYGYVREKNNILKYDGKRELNTEIPEGQKIALICTSAAKIQNSDSNKDWRDVRWFKLVNELQKRKYYVIQVGSIGDNQIPNVNLKFLDRQLPNIASLIDMCDIWITVDTFFHHFASAVKPNVGICLTPYYNNHAKHPNVTYIEKDCGKNFSDRRWWLDLQQPERKECMDLIQVDDVISVINDKTRKKLKILIASLQFNSFSGSELYVYELAKELVKLGNDVTVIADVVGGALTKKAIKENIKVFSLSNPPGYTYGTEPDNKHLLFKTSEVDYDIVHVQQNKITEFVLKLYPEIKKVATIHSEVIVFEEPVVHESIYKYICIRPQIKKKITKDYPIDKSKTTVIYNPVDSSQFNTNGLTDKNYILFIGSLNYLRQQVTFDLIERAKVENKELWIVGFSKGSPYIDDILPYNHVKYFDETENVVEFIKGASYTVSILFGRTVIESFMCGKNCLVYEINGNGDILNKKMIEPTQDIDKYSSKNIANKVLDVYYEVLN